MPRPGAPGPHNGWAAAHVDRLLESYQRLTGRELHPGPTRGAERAQAVFEAGYALLSHGTEEDPVFNYGNHTVLTLFEFAWDDFVRTPSRQSAEPTRQDERERFMRAVLEAGYSDDYSGVRISAGGRRFTIDRVTVWNVVDHSGRLYGQAATFRHWTDLPPAT